jgi:hypothetical protein
VYRPCRVMRRGAVAQLGECLTGSQEVAGSIPASSTNKINGLRVPLLFPSLCFSLTFAEHLPTDRRFPIETLSETL